MYRKSALLLALIGVFLAAGVTRSAELIVKINFQPAMSVTPEGYLPDTGEIFGDRGNGYSYGWSADGTADGRERNTHADQRYDTFIHFAKDTLKTWEIALPNGAYNVFLVCGDPSWTDMINTLDIEGVIFTDPDGQDNFDEYSGQVTVTDERMKIQMAGGGSNAKICFIDIMQFIPPKGALDPIPADKAADVPRDTALAWTAAPSTQRHHVYLGTDLDDVNNASVTNGLGVLVNGDQADAMYQPEDLLAYGQTHYWRIDEVNGIDSSVTKGQIWSFTVEPFAYPITDLTVKASSQTGGSPPIATINRSGLDEHDQHSLDMADMWISGGMPAWIQYTFDKEYRLDELWVWNANSKLELMMGFGAKDVTIEYSTDGVTWTRLENVPVFAQGTCTETYTANTKIDFAGVMARYVRLTINSTYRTPTAASLSEVRFYYVPLQAFEPQPGDGATGVNVKTDLDWRPGREATSHLVYIDTDGNAVAGGAVAAMTTTDHGYAPADLMLATEYFWKVDEVGDTGTYAGDVWSFTTEEYAVVDDFESYTNDSPKRVFQMWVDGLGFSADAFFPGGNAGNGSGAAVGYDPQQGNIIETATVHGGTQAMPLSYDNTGSAFSEATRTFDSPQDWSISRIKTLSMYFAGAAGSGGQLYAKINNTKVAYDGEAADLARSGWQAWNIDLSAVGNVSSVRSLTIGVEGSAATGRLYIDDIRLYPTAGTTTTPADPGTTGLVAYYKFDGDAKDSAGTHHASPSGSPGYAAGKVGQALYMTDDLQYVEVPYKADLGMNTFTVAAWVRVADVSYYRAVMGTRIGGDYTFDLKVEASRIHADMGSGTAWLNNSVDIVAAQGGALGLDAWHHIAYVVDDVTDTVRMYLDGVPAGTATFSGTPLFMKSGQSLGIGRCYDAANEYMHGMIDEVRIYNRVLSGEEIAWLAGRTLPMHRPL